jgi:Cd2+/Zn2+-exporting ATPase
VTVNQLSNVEAAQIDLAVGTLTVTFAEGEPDVETVGEAVRATGHALVIGRRPPEHHPVAGFVRFLLSRRNTTLTAVAALLTLLGLLLTLLAATAWPVAALDLAARIALAGAILVGGLPIAQLAWREVTVTHTLGINTLMVIAVTGATLIGEWAEAAIVVVLFALGEALEGYASDRARSALEGLLDLAPPVALKRGPDGSLGETPVEALAIGDRVVIRPGDRVSVDGVVRAGQSAVDQAPITGESVPVAKEPGDEVYAGTVNGTGALEVEVTHLAADNTLNRMVALVQQAQARQAPVQRFIDRFARIYTPAVTVAAALVAAVPPLLFAQPFWGDEGWLMRALQMLVIACPCALVISTPVSVVSAMTNAAARGVLIKGGRYLDALSRVTVFAFDKTGTLTEGEPITTDVLDVCTCGACPEHCGLQFAASLEAQSSHPLARALLRAAEERTVALSPAEEVVILAGRGVEGVVDGSAVTVASHAHFDEYFPHDPNVCRQAEELAAQGKTVILVRHDDQVCGLFAIADTSRGTSRDVIAALRDEEIRTVMLTGDSGTVAAEIGREVGVDEVLAELLPSDKMAAISELSRDGRSVAMVGDGVNDAPALAQADVGIAMGGAGSAQAMETADVVLMGDDLTQLPFVLKLSRRTRSVIVANIVFALAVKAAVFGLAAAGLATLWMAIVADVGASVAVILNGMQLRRFRK